MHKILEEALRDESIREAAKKFLKHGEFLLYGLAGTQKILMAAAGYTLKPRPTIILVSGKEKISEWRDDFAEFLPDVEVVELPELDLIEVQASTIGVERQAKRLEILARLLRGEKFIVLASAMSAVKKDFSRQDFIKYQLRVEIGQSLSIEKFLGKLIEFGYERADEIDTIGKFSVHGGIVDIFPINEPTPYRVEFFGDEIDSIRTINFDTLRSGRKSQAVTILPIKNFAKSTESFLNCAGEEGTIIFDEPARIYEAIQNLIHEDPEIKKNIFTFEQLIKSSRAGSLIYFELMMKNIRGVEATESIGITAANVTSFQGQTKFFLEEMTRLLELKQKIFILFNSQAKLNGIMKLLYENKLTGINLEIGNLNDGFTFPNAKLTVLTEKNIFGGQVKRRVKTYSLDTGDRIRSFSDIHPGDYVVHVENGIGKYLGVETLEFDGVHKDFLNIQYGGADKLFIPVEQVHYLQKYISGDGAVPKLSRLGSGDWTRAKSKASAAVEDIAEKLLELYARREKASGFAFAEDDASQREFEDAFPYEETPDQIRAVNDVKKDMERPRPMDRLICGDVGFGKTEIAIRAAYKAAMNGKQCAVLVPTTVLAQQHYQTFSERFNGFLPTVDVICRFRTPKEQRITLQKVRAGQVDILIGTHSILSSKIQFKDLGLLIIDEEHRFGVKQKEKIRALSEGVDVLTLSATPIPRTLHMSLVGARDMSLIETAPAERFPVQTYVIEDDDEIIAEALRREIRRGGQVYFVYNRIETIDLMRDRLTELVPEAKIQTAHGQMSDDFLENIMMNFYEGAFNVLLTTTIIESGLDVANANTIIIYDADNFGLAQLYQMRGRVGRSHIMAFAYFVHRSDKILGENAEKRLQAMREFAQLGAGFKIAMKDLEIRGAGNLLGAQQHGHIASVGFEMYCRLLEEAVNKLQNKTVENVEEPDPIINLPVEAFIDREYISNAGDKIEIYRRLAAMREEIEIKDLREELQDRFGKISVPVENLLLVSRIRIFAKNLSVKSLQENNLRVEITFNHLENISAQGIIELSKIFRSDLKFLENSQRVFLTFNTKKNLLTRILNVLKILTPLKKIS
ncbi:MAG: transcription-repair coupling factor [Selenomonadaceae bacterium]|nr:transcription-repair coupling factor [Selenomonadaceae bacterium]